MQAQNLSIRGTLLQKEAELLNVRDQLWRSEENERELREELIRVKKRNGTLVDHEQVEVRFTPLEWRGKGKLTIRLLSGHGNRSRDSSERSTSFPFSPTLKFDPSYSS